jgi:hypothetical protein
VIIKSQPYRIIMMAGFLMGIFSIGGLIMHLFTDTQINTFWIIVLVGILFGMYVMATDLYLSVFHSPIWLELNGNVLKVKMPFRISISIDVNLIEKIIKRGSFPLWGLYDIKLLCPSIYLTLYLRKERFEHLLDLLSEIKKVNPSCQIEDSLLKAI